MSKVDKKTVEYVAELARINLTEEEKESLGQELSKIISYVDQLKELDTQEVEPLRELQAKGDVFRPDKVSPSGCRAEILNNSPLSEGDYFKIPRVIE
ncbi:MAG: Asp-tRNA(Asn)/Glu-tRNA(Gln) amidotransferase subunit GatC [Candidatus Omnitrophica bacterium]|nr:Asp-tRNA(Asn)/Glu-tRNA(Gln) amidotransferase subunit GatC [Candidatus Omnitrophota bacterium]MBU2044251.1 Asp-tRNA(Asn)/Glu-tRNA(Gln) amidotransferase subunit GatC [Candidatus Omnitrophota bacterium]MBU2250760.1 Asp-tRNA(Asn)/Glu-tRNA(Gln) amidotransferase subunit GatC [Candidatus Omnitrophota bacterium]MBU2474072.1 Asp-tRNA(Asn)/Glu-tRNA(Gln) amidotransferase subunit GatC [Candidatus Omnitrophota bacterium]